MVELDRKTRRSSDLVAAYRGHVRYADAFRPCIGDQIPETVRGALLKFRLQRMVDGGVRSEDTTLFRSSRRLPRTRSIRRCFSTMYRRPDTRDRSRCASQISPAAHGRWWS